MRLIEEEFPLARSLGSSYVVHKVYKWSGHPRPRSALLLTYSRARPFELIRKESEDVPNTWSLALPTSDECKQQKDEITLCERIRAALIVMYLAGCTSIGERDALLVYKMDQTGQQIEEASFATQASCFDGNDDLEEDRGVIIRYVWRQYALATSAASDSGDGMIRALRSDVD